MIPLISIVITNYNYSNYIGDAIESAINQDFPNKEIIVVDDGSTDDSISVIDRYSNDINIVKQSNGGVSSARNTGVANSQGDFIAFLDADDFWMSNKISLQYQSLIDSKSDLSYCRMQLTQPDGSFTFTSENRQGDFREFYSNFPGQTPFPPSSVLLTRKLVSRVGEWDIELVNSAEDFDYFRRCSLSSEFVHVDNALVVHREHGKSLTSGAVERFFFYNIRAMLKMYKDSGMQISFFVRRLGILRFYTSLAKTYFKNSDLPKGIVVLILAALPVTCGKAIARLFYRV